MPKSKSKSKGQKEADSSGGAKSFSPTVSRSGSPTGEKKKEENVKTPTESKKVFEGLDPENPSLVPKWRFLVERGHVAAIDYHVDSFGMQLTVRVPQWTAEGVPMDPLVVSGRVAVQILKDRSVLDKFGRLAKSLTKPSARAEVATATTAGEKKKSAKPKKSLVGDDFDSGAGSAKNHLARVREVAQALGVNTIRGRMLSAFGKPREGVSTIEGWWVEATPESRLRVLMDGSRLTELQGQPGQYELAKQCITETPCPFRGALRPSIKGKEVEATITAE
jgi:hypothetical protein